MRNTDDDWTNIGEFEPYYGVLTYDKFLRKNLNEESLAEFWKTGADHIDYVRQRIIRVFGDFTSENAIDFGSGVGRLTRAIAQHATKATGVDVSPAMITEAESHALPNTRFVRKIPDGPYDWINSAIVFQHIPPDRGYEFFQKLLDGASDDCVLSVHFMIFKDRLSAMHSACFDVEYAMWSGGDVKPLIRSQVDPGYMSMFDYDLNKLIAMLVRSGFTRYYLEHANHGGSHGVEILSKRG